MASMRLKAVTLPNSRNLKDNSVKNLRRKSARNLVNNPQNVYNKYLLRTLLTTQHALREVRQCLAP